MIFLKYGLDYLRKKLVHTKLTVQDRISKAGNQGVYLNSLALKQTEKTLLSSTQY